ncbi:hypothetical protein NW761_001438 [Fusarium oxysporum]|nr:hypothetical protein NW761_001438 [Fusarium oxysporum]
MWNWITNQLSSNGNSDITGKIFIQVSKADDFRRKHDRSKDMYTCRFVESLMAAAGEEAAKVARSLGIDSGKDIIEWAKKYMGDDLREF